MELARESKRKATTEAKSSSSMAPAIQHKRMAVEARQSDATNSTVMPHHPAVEKRSLVVNDDDDDDNNNDVTHLEEANQKGDLDSDDHDSSTNDAVNSSGSILIMFKNSKITISYAFSFLQKNVTRQKHKRNQLPRRNRRLYFFRHY